MVLQLYHIDRHTLVPPHTGVGAWPAVLVHGVEADVGPLCPRVIGQSQVRPLAPYTVQIRPSVVVAERILQHRPVDQSEMVYEGISPLPWGPAVPLGVDAVGQSGGP